MYLEVIVCNCLVFLDTPVTQVAQTKPPVQPIKPSTSVREEPSVPGEPYNPEEPSIEVEESDDIKKNVVSNSQTSTSTEETDSQGEVAPAQTVNTEEVDSRTQDELVQIAMGNVPLTPIVGTQPTNMFPMNGTYNPDLMQQQHQQQQQQQQQQQHAHLAPTQSMFPGTYVPDLIRHTFLPVNNQQQYQLQLQQQQQQQQQQQAVLMNQQKLQQQPNVVPVSSKQPYHKSPILEIRKIPAVLNNIVKLSEHFQKFGTITKLEVSR